MMRTLVLALALTIATCCRPTAAAGELLQCYLWPIVSVYGGDTATVEVLPGVYSRVRFMGYNAPEINGHCEVEKALALKARDYARKLLGSKAQFCVVNKFTMTPRPPLWDRRTYAWVSVGSLRMSEAMVAAGLARFYSGGPRQSWCSGLERKT